MIPKMKNSYDSFLINLCLVGALFFTIVDHTNAQSDYRQGYIVTLNLDTIRGLVDYSIFSNDFEKCKFKVNDQVSEYKAGEIMGFGFDKDKYMVSGLKEGLFVEQLLQGSNHNLYKDENSFFVTVKVEDKIYHLTKKDSVYFDANGKKFLRNDRKWQGILKVIVNDCQSLEISDNLRFQEGSLVSLFEKYEECKGGTSLNFKKSKPLFSSSFGIIGGPSLANITIDDDKYRYENVTFGSKVFQVGAYFAVSSPRFSENISLQPEVHFIKTTAKDQRSFERSSFTSIYDTEIDISTLAIPILLKYRVVSSNYKLFLLAGLSVEFNKGNKLFSKQTQVIESQNISTEEIYTEFVNYMPKQSLGPVAGFNLEKNVGKHNLGLSLRAQKLFPLGTRTYIFNQSRINALLYFGF